MEVVDGVAYAPAKDFWGWFDEFEDPWKPVMAELTEAFGTKFYMQHTGGGCMALEAVFESGLTVMVTEAHDVLGRFQDRDDTTGYAVGVYPMEDCDCWWRWVREFDDDGVERRVRRPWKEKCDHPRYAAQESTGWAASEEADSVPQLVDLIKAALQDSARQVI